MNVTQEETNDILIVHSMMRKLFFAPGRVTMQIISSPASVFKVSFILQINYFSGKVSEEALTEEEQLNDLLLLIKLLTNLLSKDIIDFGSGQ